MRDAREKLAGTKNGMVDISNDADNFRTWLIKLSGQPSKKDQPSFQYYVLKESECLGEGNYGGVYPVYLLGDNDTLSKQSNFVFKLFHEDASIVYPDEGKVADQLYPVQVGYFPFKERDFVTDDQQYVIKVLKLIPGKSLESRGMQAYVSQCALEVKANLALQATLWLQDLQKNQGLIHQDLSASNTIITYVPERKIRKGGETKIQPAYLSFSIIDFGICASIDNAKHFSNACMAKSNHIAPEMATKDVSLSGKTDIFMLVGIIGRLFGVKQYNPYQTRHKLAQRYLKRKKEIKPEDDESLEEAKHAYHKLIHSVYDLELVRFPNKDLARVTQLFLLKMMSFNPSDRPNIDEVVNFFRVLHQYALQASQHNDRVEAWRDSLLKVGNQLTQARLFSKRRKEAEESFKKVEKDLLDELLIILSSGWPIQIDLDSLSKLPEKNDNTFALDAHFRQAFVEQLCHKNAPRFFNDIFEQYYAKEADSFLKDIALLREVIGQVRKQDLHLMHETTSRGRLIHRVMRVAQGYTIRLSDGLNPNTDFKALIAFLIKHKEAYRLAYELFFPGHVLDLPRSLDDIHSTLRSLLSLQPVLEKIIGVMAVQAVIDQYEAGLITALKPQYQASRFRLFTTPLQRGLNEGSIGYQDLVAYCKAHPRSAATRLLGF